MDISVIDFFMKICVYIVVEYEYFNILDMFLDRCLGVNNLSKGDVFDRVFIYYVVMMKDVKVFVVKWW